ncbi:hypothetical protein Pan241w_27870 [Gimesia alba]|uniref:Uncharacterized protein n=1 Tax=Gimesia alba TaxID=2527973 RepID=A0A517RFP7_9PLAN|nr:hypothetical protein [Gimesia alba]QDT42699.1 hypothetical protein Pan241w_27870 [Gimesia alba]
MADLLNNLDSQLWNCEHAFSNLCPKQWAELTPTETPGVRFCDVCSENVTYCTTPEEFVQLGNAGKCVAIPNGYTTGSLKQMLLGRISVKKMKSNRDRQERTANWWRTVIEADPEFGKAALEEIAQLTKRQCLEPRGLSDEQRETLVQLKQAISTGPEALYRHLRLKPNGQPDNQQNIFRQLRSHFKLTYRECKELAQRVESTEAE